MIEENMIKEEPSDEVYINNYQYESCSNASSDFKPKRKRQHRKDIHEKKLLASLVRQQPLLYDKRNSARVGTSLVDVEYAWLEVVRQMPEGTTVEQCKKWWKSLQDALRYREKMKCMAPCTEDEDSDWIYKDDVDFLQERTAKTVKRAQHKKAAKLQDPLAKIPKNPARKPAKELKLNDVMPTTTESTTNNKESATVHVQQPQEPIATANNNLYKERMELLAKNVCLKLQNITDLKQCLLAEKLINDTLFYAELGELTMFHTIVKTTKTCLGNT